MITLWSTYAPVMNLKNSILSHANESRHGESDLCMGLYYSECYLKYLPYWGISYIFFSIRRGTEAVPVPIGLKHISSYEEMFFPILSWITVKIKMSWITQIEAVFLLQPLHNTLQHRSANFFCKGPDTKHLSLQALQVAITMQLYCCRANAATGDM